MVLLYSLTGADVDNAFGRCMCFFEDVLPRGDVEVTLRINAGGDTLPLPVDQHKTQF